MEQIMIQGNVMVGQSGGPTSVINASLVGVFQAAREAGVTTVYGMRNGIEGLLKEEYVDLGKHITSDLDIELLKRTPSSFLGSCRFKLPDMRQDEKPYRRLFAILDKLNVKYVIYIGGNDSMDTIMKLSAYALSIKSEIRFMGVPKTIDNDLAETDHTPGYGSAAKYVASAMKEIICDSDVYNMESVTIVEIMGRNAGWLTAASALSKGEDCAGPDLICLPERPFDAELFLERIEKLRKEKKTVIAAVSEALRDKDGRYVCEGDVSPADAFGHKIITGSALYLSDLVRRRLGIKARGIVFNTLQRCASHLVSRRDMTEAFMAGSQAMRAALKGHSGEMVIFRRVSNEPYQILMETCDVYKIANTEKTVPDAWITQDGTGVTDAFLEYSRPLIIGELAPFMVGGLPRHLFLREE
ncbi:6-phosphofructokinase [Oscillospiraceae bacterium DSM 107454]|uniref:Pyrophosphate--fructose 6-phosphate 1-phosphotransferase n=1 Tax=Ructibacterium gallinarum TaxID=2779355 RepID=A0A9D5LZZ9_9FIRM|nr:6-phosphofructokinase [Ructibacterium gallinarum]MBE5041086.1 6-phosphofructokinase [Ructibacterium gallinarum]